MNRRQFVKLAQAFPAAAVSASLVLREDGKTPVELDVSVLKCEPGDTLVLSTAERVSMDTAARIQHYVADRFDGRVKVMLLSDGITLDGVLRA